MDAYGKVKLHEAIQFAVSHVTGVAYYVGADIGNKWGPSFGLSNVKHCGTWWHGHGFSINVRLSSTLPSSEIVRSSEFQLLSMSDMFDSLGKPDSEALIWSAQSAIDEIIPLLSWSTKIATCDGPWHKYSTPGLFCTPFGDKWLCDKCMNAFSLPAPTIHPDSYTKKENTERLKMTASLRWKILERDNFTCKACGACGDGVVLHVDHKIPIARGGLTIESNLHTLCRQCNLGKRDAMPRQETLLAWGVA